ncbi:MAG: hypothetical protein RMM31_10725 [Anaerolineae bacterium]|nr:hypothetical protein [Thermoflexales bacterium]MDW8396703.1 hypothetical protein [Anaerolineae bacterium]
MNRVRSTLLWIGTGIIAFLSLSAPFAFGFVYYLGVSDGLEINAGDPLRQSRVWMIREFEGPSGIGWMRTAPVAAPQSGVQCAQTELIVFNWRGGLSIERQVAPCKCYTPSANGKLKESALSCSQP